jgi:site-specific DNA recombinase
MRAALYARVSTTRQAENDLSIPDQLKQMRDWCQSAGHAVVAEFVEPGASATDDKRPVFRKMISDAAAKPAPFDLIIVHSLSRFFRDQVEFGVHERKLRKIGVRVISITQPISDDSTGVLTQGMITLFDAHLSGEISKHTTRGMRENARQGYFNGSRPPFGYKTAVTDRAGTRGRMRKKLVIDEDERTTVQKIYALYLAGDQGKEMGCKEIVNYLNKNGLLMRGQPWRIQKIHRILSDTLYIGVYNIFVRNSKEGTRRPPEEWITVDIPPIIDAETFRSVADRRKSRAPSSTPPRVTSSPTLLTGILKCGVCGSSLTITTGKSGRYKYYKCTNRQNKGNSACTSGNIPMETMDKLVLDRLANVVFTPERLQSMVESLRKRMADTQSERQDQVNQLARQLKILDERRGRLLDAIETGAIAPDEMTRRRDQEIKIARDALSIQLDEARRRPGIGGVQLRQSQIAQFGEKLRQRLLAGDPEFAKPYIRALVSEIVVNGRIATIHGSDTALTSAIAAQKKERHSKSSAHFYG